MRGTVKKDGATWYFVCDVGIDTNTGKRKQFKRRGFATKKEAEAALAQTITDYERGTFLLPSKTTVEEFIGEWLQNKQSSVRKSTYRSYEWLARKHIYPHIGHIRLAKLTPLHLQRMYSDLQKGDKPLSKRSVLHVHLVLQEALDRAVKWNMVIRNVAKAVEPPRPPKKQFSTWSKEEIIRFLEASKDDRYYIAFLLAIMTGMRKGEILGLRWRDIDFQTNVLSVRQTLSYTGKGSEFQAPKTDHGRRAIVLPSQVIEELRKHKVAQAKEKLQLGAEYNDTDLVVATSHGTPVTARALDKSWYELRERANVPCIRFHDLRHTHASLMLLLGTHPKVVSERLGHANIGITLDTYSHVMPGLQEAAATQFGDEIFGTNNKLSTTG